MKRWLHITDKSFNRELLLEGALFHWVDGEGNIDHRLRYIRHHKHEILIVDDNGGTEFESVFDESDKGFLIYI